jgi:DNA-directed RNA polymerase specialized sigma24 family protein
MTRDRPYPTSGNDNGSDDRQSPQNERTDTCEQTDADLIRARRFASMLSHFEILSEKEAQAFAFREIGGFDRQRTAKETDMSPSDVNVYFCTAQVRITEARKYLEYIEDASCSVESRNG